MKTALCFCPDLAFFRPAIYAAASLICAGDAGAYDIFIVCEAEDVPPGFDQLDPQIKQHIQILRVDFAHLVDGLQGRGRFPKTIFRRLFLDAVLPETYERIVYLDADTKIARAGLSRLTTLDFGDKPFAAALDMIYLLQFREDALGRRFEKHRRALGLEAATPYCNSGLLAFDRKYWREHRVTARVIETLQNNPDRFAFPEQDALNHLFAGEFAFLSPRYNFMGDFFLLDLETKFEPIVLHFVNAPKPWSFSQWRGEARFARDYQQWFAASPWPDWPSVTTLRTERNLRPRRTIARKNFAERLMAFLARQDFVDA